MRDDQGLRANAAVTFDSGLAIGVTREPLGFTYGPGIFGPEPERRSLDSIRATLRDRFCQGPDPVYAIAMDVGMEIHREELQRRRLLFGIVTYAAGRLGREPIRSQGHVHRVSPGSGWSPPELYEIWSGRAIVLMQELVAEDPGRCFAIEADPGDVVVVPPGWAHATISADPSVPLTFGAWCDREYGFEYSGVRAYGGLAFFPILTTFGVIEWEANGRYGAARLRTRRPRQYQDLGLMAGEPIYRTFARNPDSIQWVSDPGRLAAVWGGFEP